MRTLTAASKGKIPGPEGSIGKLFGAQVMTQMGELALGDRRAVGYRARRRRLPVEPGHCSARPPRTSRAAPTR